MFYNIIWMAQGKSHVICIQNISKLGDNDLLCLQKKLAIVYGPVSSYTHAQRLCVPSSQCENSLLRESTIIVIIIVISILILLQTRYLIT